MTKGQRGVDGAGRDASARRRLTSGLLVVAMMLPLLVPVDAAAAPVAADGGAERADQAPELVPTADRHDARGRGFSPARRRAEERGSARLLVELDVPWQPEPRQLPAQAQQQRQRIAGAQAAVRAALAGTDHQLGATYRTLPHLAVTAGPDAIAALERSPFVASVSEDVLEAPALSESVPLIHGDVAQDRGFTGGAGAPGEDPWAIAVIDTGVYTAHPFFADRLVAEACFTNGECEDAESEANGTGAAEACLLTNCDHGSHVAGIALGAATDGAPGSGVAPDAELLAAQVFSTFNSWTDCAPTQPTPCVLARRSDTVAALEWVYELRDDHRIAAVNLSLGSGQYEEVCDEDAPVYAAAISQLRAANIAVVTSSGNGSLEEALGAPACIDDAISVGNTTIDDRVNPSSNSADFLDLLAPGTDIVSSTRNDGYVSKTGTSMAAPHVAGAFALLRQQRPDDTVAALLQSLTDTGVRVVDSRNGLLHRRIDVAKALGLQLCPDDAAYGNDSLSTAYLVAPNSSTPAMACTGQDHYYEVDLLEGQTLDAGLRFTYEDVDLRLDLLDEAGTLVQPGESASPGQALNYFSAAGGTYLVRVSYLSGALDGTLDEAHYRLELQADTCPPTGPATLTDADAVEVASGERFFGVNCAENSLTRHRIHGHAGSELTLAATDASSLVYLGLYRPNGGSVGNAENLLPGEQVTYDLPVNGEYVLRVVRPYGEGEFFSLIADVSVCPGTDRYGPNGTLATAHELGYGARVEHAVICAGEQSKDLYAVDAFEGSPIQVDIQPAQGDGQLQVEVLDGSGTVLAGPVPAAQAATLTATAPAKGRFYVRVSGDGPGVARAYDLDVSVGVCPADDPYENNSIRDLAHEINDTTPLHGVLCWGDEDWYRVDTVEGADIEVALDYTRRRDDGFDVLELLVDSPNGTTIATSATDTDGEQLLFTAPETGSYYVQVSGREGIASNTYSLTVDVPELCPPDDRFAPNHTAAEASWLGFGRQVAGILCADEPEDHFAVHAFEGMELTVDLAPNKLVLPGDEPHPDDVEVALYGPDGDRIVGSDDEQFVPCLPGQACEDGPAVGTPFTRTVTEDGTYRVRVWTPEPDLEPVYGLTVSGDPCSVDGPYPSNTFDDAYVLAPEEEAVGYRCGGFNTMFAVDLEPGEDLEAVLRRPRGPRALELVLFTPDTFTPLEWEWDPDADQVELTHRVQQAGTHYLLVYAQSNVDEGEFRLRYDLSPAVDELPPVVDGLAVDLQPVAGSGSVTVFAIVDDTDTGGSAVTGAQLRVDDDAWQDMDPADGAAFGAVSVAVEAVVDLGDVAVTRELCVRGQDVADNVGDPVCLDVEVVPGPLAVVELASAPPATVDPDEPFGLEVLLDDGFGNTPAEPVDVGVTIESGTEDGALAGGTVLAGVIGQAVFEGLTLDTPGVYTLTVHAGEVSVTTNQIEVATSGPTAALAGPVETDEGQPVTLDASASEDPAGGGLSFAWDLTGNGGFEDATGRTTEFDAVGLRGERNVAVRVTDADGNTDTAGTTVAVTNLPPEVQSLEVTTDPAEGDTVRVRAEVSDPGWESLLTVTADWGHGDLPPTVLKEVALTGDDASPDGITEVQFQQVYGDAGTFQITVCADDGLLYSCTTTEVVVTNVDPTVVLSTDEARRVHDSFVQIVRVQQVADFEVAVTDPGSDDLTVDWSFGDATETTVHYPVGETMGSDRASSPVLDPRDVTDDQQHTYLAPCPVLVEVTATDDDGGSDTATLDVVVVGDDEAVRDAKTWRQVFADEGATGPGAGRGQGRARGGGRGLDGQQPAEPDGTDGGLDQETLDCYLAVIGALSATHGPDTDVAAVLQPGGGPNRVARELSREVLAAWLNVASGSLVHDRSVADDDADLLATLLAAETATSDAERQEFAALLAGLNAG